MPVTSSVQPHSALYGKDKLFQLEVQSPTSLTLINRVFIITGLIISIGLAFLWVTTDLYVDDCYVPDWYAIEDCSISLFSFAIGMLFLLSLVGAFLGLCLYGIGRLRESNSNNSLLQESPAIPHPIPSRMSNPLASVRIASPCTADWNLMYGDERLRFCRQCNLNVYNLSAMSKREAENLIVRTEGPLCVRYYRREDGTILTQNCPVRVQAIKKKLSRIRTHILGATLSISTFFSFLGASRFLPLEDEELSNNPGNLETVPESILLPDSALPESPSQWTMIMGGMQSVRPVPAVWRSEEFMRQLADFIVIPHYNLRTGFHVKGVVRVWITVSEEGKVVRAIAISGKPELTMLAETAAMRWTFHLGFPDEELLPMRIDSVLTFPGL